MIKFFVIANRHGQTRLAQYYGERPALEERQRNENEIIRQCVSKNGSMSFSFQHDEQKIVYKRYLALYCIAGVEEEANELAVISFFDFFFQTLKEYFGDITEFHLIYHLPQAYSVLNEIVMDGVIVETSKTKIISNLTAIYV